MTVVLYIEGGGDNRRQSAQFREGWTKFFAMAGLGGRMPKVVRGGSRQQTFDQFAADIVERRPDVIPLLLVDSEDSVRPDHSVWQHLKARKDDHWDRPIGAGDDDAFLMVQVMETWFLADRDALRTYFGAQFVESALKQWPELEAVSKKTVFDALDKATAQCQKRYAKGKISFELLARVDPTRVEAACPHAKALLDRLESL